jgi:hypothetical protein
MIIELSSGYNDLKHKLDDPHQESTSSAGPSVASPPPPFPGNDYGMPGGDESTETTHLAVDFPSDAEHPAGPPPEFSPYEAEYFEVGYNDVVSHDPHLNSDGEALYRFLLAQSQKRPSQRLHCHGSHTETRNRWVTERDSNGRSRHRQESYTETVVDFDFCIDITSDMPVKHEPVHWSVGDDEPAYRGKMVREYGPIPSVQTGLRRHLASRKETNSYKKWVNRRDGLGLPPWVREEDGDRTSLLEGSTVNLGNPLRSSKTLRQWADEYCESPKYLKEFTYEKKLYGWNFQQIESAVRSTIEATPYRGSLTVRFASHGRYVFIRPDNKVSRMLSNKWLKFLSIILLVFPFIWLFKRFHSRGGGRWEVCGGAYPMKLWVPAESPHDIEAAALAGERLPAYSDSLTPSPGSWSPWTRSPSNLYMQTPSGPMKLLGQKEGEWFRQWEGAITRAVLTGYQSPIPLPSSTSSPAAVQLLDGYNDPI